MMFLCIECEKSLDGSRFYRKVKNRCKDCLNKKFKCDFCEKFFTKKWLKTHIEREHHQDKTNSNAIIDNVNNNNRTLLVGPSFSGKTYLMSKNSFTYTRERHLYNHLITPRTIYQF